MTLKEYKDYFKNEFGWTDSISIGKIDNNQEKALCFYDSKSSICFFVEHFDWWNFSINF